MAEPVKDTPPPQGPEPCPNCGIGLQREPEQVPGQVWFGCPKCGHLEYWDEEPRT